jgi:hypothetical protein
MAFTTTARIKALINQVGTGFHAKPSDEAITQAADSANAELEKLGVAASETNNALLMAADRLALSYLIEGLIVQQTLRGNPQATGSLRIFAMDLRASALLEAGAFVLLSRRETTIARNRNWANERGGPLRRGSEAGRVCR